MKPSHVEVKEPSSVTFGLRPWSLIIEEAPDEMKKIGIVVSVEIINGDKELTGSLYLDQDGINLIFRELDAYGATLKEPTP